MSEIEATASMGNCSISFKLKEGYYGSNGYGETEYNKYFNDKTISLLRQEGFTVTFEDKEHNYSEPVIGFDPTKYNCGNSHTHHKMTIKDATVKISW